MATVWTTYSWSSGERGVVLSSFFWGYLVSQVPFGYMTARVGPKWLMLAGVLGPAALAAFTPLIANWGGWQLLCASRVLQGLLQVHEKECHSNSLKNNSHLWGKH
ncbi:Sialin [Frankliniella fusca]|uniref:Sialin n=1 Tax=Frankliniella fusca TaxID=407009 RepID=A0AAE1HQM8_9NEOP|nr:Sialin [Frankliniella fusca]